MAHRGLFFRLRADHEARGVAERDDRDVEGVAQLHEARGLVASRGPDGAAEMARVVGDQAERPALDAQQRGDQAGSELAPQFQHAARSARTSIAWRMS